MARRKGCRDIPETLLIELVQYVCFGMDEKYENCKRGLEEELQRIAQNDLFRLSKTAASNEERRKALEEWYESKGIPKDFRRI